PRVAAAVRLTFFFQAEDGIRDFHVTGVQTCALPILIDADPAARRSRRIVLRPEQPRIAVDEADGLALVPHVVAGGDDIDAGGVEIGRASCRERVQTARVAAPAIEEMGEAPRPAGRGR